jgi:ATP-dependent DNA helicase RecG
MISVPMKIEDLLRQEEGKRLDFKRNLSSLEPVLRDIIAFANSAGGTVVVGVADQKKAPGKPASKRVVGLSDPYGDEEKLMDAVAQNIEPLIRVDVQGTTFDGKSLLLVEVSHQLGPVHLKSKGEEEGTYIRLGTTNRVADRARLEELRSGASSKTWDERPHGSAARDALNEDLAEEIFQAQGAGHATEAALRTNKLLVGDPGALIPSNAGLILLAREPSEAFPDAHFRCITYPADRKGSRSIDDQRFDNETVLEALEQVQAYILEHTPTVRQIEGMTRQEGPAYSEVMVREILINAIAHADYNLTGAPLRVTIYSDHLEIQNPGTFPPGMSIEDLKDGVSVVRNRAIAKTLNTLRLMEEQGTAWARIQEAVEGGYPAPEWREAGPTMIVTLFPHSAFTPSLPQSENEGVDETEGVQARRPQRRVRERRDRLLKLISRKEPIRAPALAKQVGVSTATIERDLAAMIKEEIVWFDGPPRTGGYRIKRDG